MNPIPDAHPTADADVERLRYIENAQRILRGTDATPRQTFDLADQLKKVNEFGYARRLFGRIQAKGDYAGVRKGATPKQALQTRP